MFFLRAAAVKRFSFPSAQEDRQQLRTEEAGARRALLHEDDRLWVMTAAYALADELAEVGKLSPPCLFLTQKTHLGGTGGRGRAGALLLRPHLLLFFVLWDYHQICLVLNDHQFCLVLRLSAFSGDLVLDSGLVTQSPKHRVFFCCGLHS